MAATVISSFASISNVFATVDPALPITSILYAERDVPVGAEITAADLKVHWIETSKKPNDALVTVFQAVGLKAKYQIVKGQIVSDHDFVDYYPAQRTKTVVVLRIDSALYQKLQKASLQKKVTINQLCGGILARHLGEKK